jgi:ribonuclease HII
VPDLTIESGYQGIVVGVDEAGRGPWAGPVVAAAVNLKKPPNDSFFSVDGINDSKKMSAAKREILYELIVNNCEVGVGVVGIDDIESLNILGATKKAMCLAVSVLKTKPDVVLIDGNQPPEMECEVLAIVKGDQKSLSIAAASIIAKVTRDEIMKDLHLKHPFFGWDTNAGYGTKAHQAGLAEHGITKHHRKTFAPIMKIIQAV